MRIASNVKIDTRSDWDKKPVFVEGYCRVLGLFPGKRDWAVYLTSLAAYDKLKEERGFAQLCALCKLNRPGAWAPGPGRVRGSR